MGGEGRGGGGREGREGGGEYVNDYSQVFSLKLMFGCKLNEL